MNRQRMFSSAVFLCSIFGTSISNASLVLSEVMYDPSSTDNNLEWIEIFNNGPSSINLSGYSLGWGGNDYTYGNLTLSGSIASGSYFVIGGPSSDATNANPLFDLAIDFSPDMQNGGTQSDGVALFNITADMITAGSIPIDAVIYDLDGNLAGLLGADGLAAMPMVGDAPAGSSIERMDLIGNWAIQSTPTPGFGPLVYEGSNEQVSPVPLPPSLAMFIPGLLSLFGIQRFSRRQPS